VNHDHSYSARMEADPGEAADWRHVQCSKCRGVHFARESRRSVWIGVALFVIVAVLSFYRLTH
jgi:hypothetical protein